MADFKKPLEGVPLDEEDERDRLARLWWQDRDREGFKKPFKAVPLKPRVRGLDEMEASPWTPQVAPEKINWTYLAVGLFIGICSGLAYVIWMNP